KTMTSNPDPRSQKDLRGFGSSSASAAEGGTGARGALDPRLAAIERAIRETALKALERGDSVSEIVEKLKLVGEMGCVTRRQAAAAEHELRREQMLAEVARHEREGRGWNAVTLVARKFAVDPDDEIEVQSLSRQLRRWRRKSDTVRLSCKKSGTAAT